MQPDDAAHGDGRQAKRVIVLQVVSGNEGKPGEIRQRFDVVWFDPGGIE